MYKSDNAIDHSAPVCFTQLNCAVPNVDIGTYLLQIIILLIRLTTFFHTFIKI